MIRSNEYFAAEDITFKADLTLQRLRPRLEEVWRVAEIDDAKRHDFEVRLHQHWRSLFELFFQLYGTRYDFFIVLANFSEHPQVMHGNKLRTTGLGRFFHDLIQDKTHATSEPFRLEPYQLVWLRHV